MTQSQGQQFVGELGVPLFDWKNHSRFVEVVPVRSGWLVAWGTYADLGATRSMHGSRVYLDLSGVRRRIWQAVVDLIDDRTEADDALSQFDKLQLRDRLDLTLPEPI